MPNTRLIDYPIKFNTTVLFKPQKWERKRNKVSNTNTSEAGTDLINLIRSNKISISAEFACTSAWAAIFEQFNDMPSFSLFQYEPSENGYRERIVRMENYSEVTEELSEYVTQSTGLYNVSFDLIEI